MRTSRYEVFMKIVETQSLTKTAAYFGCTQSAVSQLVKALETELGVSLLVRGKSGRVFGGNHLLFNAFECTGFCDGLCFFLDEAFAGKEDTAFFAGSHADVFR